MHIYLWDSFMAKCAHTHAYTHTDRRVDAHRHRPAEGPGTMPWGEEEEEKKRNPNSLFTPKTYNFV